MHQFAVEPDAAGIGLDGTVDDFHQGRFAGPVFTQHGVDVAWHDAQAHVAVGQHAGVAFADAGKL